ncbi:hypothetical protein C8F01DRAFT_1179463 [Mycena amicta]|nr:hypothetical protein C8F01DRAFT_1179463 [Mycena amicta]
MDPAPQGPLTSAERRGGLIMGRILCGYIAPLFLLVLLLTSDDGQMRIPAFAEAVAVLEQWLAGMSFLVVYLILLLAGGLWVRSRIRKSAMRSDSKNPASSSSHPEDAEADIELGNLQKPQTSPSPRHLFDDENVRWLAASHPRRRIVIVLLALFHLTVTLVAHDIVSLEQSFTKNLSGAAGYILHGLAGGQFLLMSVFYRVYIGRWAY